jgi:hypothetical protein
LVDTFNPEQDDDCQRRSWRTAAAIMGGDLVVAQKKPQALQLAAKRQRQKRLGHHALDVQKSCCATQ